jgi:hypothetical protein
MVHYNAAAMVSTPRVTRREVSALSPANARLLLDAARGDRLEALYSVALARGLRQGEALGLKWADVNLETGVLRVRRASQRVPHQGTQLVETKAERSRRTLVMPPIVISALCVHFGLRYLLFDRMADTLTDFFQLADREFSWLVREFGFREVMRDSKTEGNSPMFGKMGWASSQTFVEVVLECINRPYIDVTFGALAGGQLPDVMDSRSRYHLSGLVVVRGHDEKRATKLGGIGGLRKGQVGRGLRDCAKTLRDLASDVLADDHTVFKELAAFGEWQMSQYRSKYLQE